MGSRLRMIRAKARRSPQLQSLPSGTATARQGNSPTNPTTNSSLLKFVTIRVINLLVATVACAISCGSSSAQEPSPSEEHHASPLPGEKADESVPREFLGFANVSEFSGVIDDPDGYVNLRKEKRADATVITKVKAGDPFQFKKKEGEDWCDVKLKSGVSGWMDCSRIKLYFTRDDLPPKSKKGVEIDEEAREQGINYYDVTQAAA